METRMEVLCQPLNQCVQLCYIAQRADMAIAAGASMSVFTYRTR